MEGASGYLMQGGDTLVEAGVIWGLDERWALGEWSD